MRLPPENREYSKIRISHKSRTLAILSIGVVLGGVAAATPNGPPSHSRLDVASTPHGGPASTQVDEPSSQPAGIPPRAASQPLQTFHSLDELFALIPAKLRPKRPDMWIAPLAQAASKWLAENTIGHPAELHLKIFDVVQPKAGPHKGEWVVSSTQDGQVICYFQGSEPAARPRITPGQTATIRGRIVRIGISGGMGKVWLEVDLADCELIP